MLCSCPSFVFGKFCLKTFRNSSTSAKSNLEKVLLSMPKNPKHLNHIQTQRLKNKQKLTKYVPGKVTLQVLGTGAKGAPRSLYVFSDQSRYLFNCGEGTQRLAHELKLKLSKLEHIFITHPIWQNFGGLPGLTLTMQDVGVPFVNIHGPSGMKEMFAAAKKFIVLKNLKVQIADSNPTEIFEDNVMKVQYVPLARHSETLTEDEAGMDIAESSVTSKTIADLNMHQGTSTTPHKRSTSIGAYLSDDTSSNSSGKSRKRRRRRKRRSRSLSIDASTNSASGRLNDFNNSFSLTKDKGIAMCYVCRLQPRPGALCLEKCVALGVPPGPLLGKLKSGETVTLQDGAVIKPHQVCEPDDPGPVFIVVDCPSEEYIPALINNDIFKKHQKFAKTNEDIASVVIHFTSKKILEDPRYQSWIDLFVPSTQHLILNEANTCMGSISVHRIQHKLNMIHPEIFPLLGDKGTIVEKEQGEGTENGQNHKTYAHSLSAIHLRPHKGIDRCDEIKLNPKEYIAETMSIEGFDTALNNLKIKIENNGPRTPRDFPKVVFLGTGSCIPNKTRNTSGILLETATNQKVLLDCGEGTYGQIVRFFGKEHCDKILADINAIYISHMHADHHIGVTGVLQGRQKALENLNREHKPVVLLAPLQLFTWLSFYNRYFENVTNEFEFVPNSDLLYTGHNCSDILYEKILQTLNMQDINTCFVKHCPNAFGIALTLQNGTKITYSGDTMPCRELVELGMESDLLIHEATMEDDLHQEAVMKMHSTTTEAINVGKEMNAKHILLTHFSQRYAKLPIFNENFADNVGIAFDNMQVRLDDLPLLPHFNSVLKIMFTDHYDEMEHKAMKRHLRNERENELYSEKQKLKKIQ